MKTVHTIISIPVTITLEKETDGSWIAEILEMPGVLVYGKTKRDAQHKVYMLSRQVIIEKVGYTERTV